MARRRGSGAAPSVSVLRLGHRPGRDPRLTTHVALAARALGAERLFLHPPDPALAGRIADVARDWGGRFEVVGVDDWRRTVRQFDGPVIHLTMYGEPIDRVLPALAGEKRVLAVVGGAKVPSEIYRLASRNVAVGDQPHSEVAAVAVFIDRLRGTPAASTWTGARRRIVPQARGKRVRVANAPRGRS